MVSFKRKTECHHPIPFAASGVELCVQLNSAIKLFSCPSVLVLLLLLSALLATSHDLILIFVLAILFSQISFTNYVSVYEKGELYALVKSIFLV